MSGTKGRTFPRPPAAEGETPRQARTRRHRAWLARWRTGETMTAIAKSEGVTRAGVSYAIGALLRRTLDAAGQ